IAEVSTSMIAGDVQLVCTSPVGAKPVMDRGVGTQFAVASAKRPDFMPDTPTFSESSGLKPLVVGATIGVLAKAGTPEAVVTKLAADIQKAMTDPEVKSKIESLGMEVVTDGPDAYAKTIQEELDRYGEMVKVSGATAG